jgi:hypothetical protein
MKFGSEPTRFPDLYRQSPPAPQRDDKIGKREGR